MTEALSIAQSTLKHRLEDVPEPVLRHIQMGLTLLAGLAPERRENIIRFVVSNFARRGSYDAEEAARITGLERNVIGDLLSAVTLVIGAVYDLDVNREDFERFAPDVFKTEVTSPVTEELLKFAYERKNELKEEVAAAKVANEVLPSFRYVNCAVDIRLQFDGQDNITYSVPVAVIYIATDSDSQQLWVQAAEHDLSVLIEQLEKARRRLRTALSAKL